MAFPYYLSIGMTPEQYWDGENDLKKAFRLAFKKKMQHQNQMAWLQGSYIYDVLIRVAPLYQTFAKKKEPIPYPNEPYAIDKDEREQKEKETAERKYRERIANMKDRMEKWNSRFKRK